MKKQVQFLTLFYTIFLSFGLTALGSPFQETTSPDSDGKKINFQGTLYENSAPVNGDRQFTFKIELGNDQTWTETHTTSVLNGLYSVVLGSVTPLPYDLFFDSEERTIQVSIGNTVLGSSIIYAPFALNDNEEFGTAIFQLEAKSPTDTVALTGEIYGVGNNSEYAAGLRGFAHTDTTSNTGISGIAYGGQDNKAYNTAVRGDSYSNTPEAWATGIWGISNAYSGGISYGVRGEARGQGSTFSAAMRGLNFVEPGENGLRYGGFFNTYNGENSPFNGESVGVRGSATGSMSNVGVWGTANGTEGTDNWAGRFDGNVAIRDGALKLSQEGQSFASISRNEQNSGSITLKSSVDSVNILIDSNGGKAGLIHLNDSLGRANFKMLTYAGGGSYLEQHAGIPDIGETRVTYQLVGNANPWTNMIARNADGTAKGRVQSGWLPGGGEEIGQFRISTGDNRTLAQLIGDGQNGGSMFLEGPNSPLIHMGSLNWEGNDGVNRARIALFGNDSEDDGNGGTYTPERIALNVNKDDAGTEFGSLNLTNSSGGGFEAGSRGWENNNQGGTKSFAALKGTQDIDDGNGGTYRPWLVAQEIHDDGNGEYATLNVNGTNGGNISLNGWSGDINISGVVNQSSDARLKKNVTTITSGLATITQLRGVRYNWKDDSKPENKIGFIAQEVEEVLPELVKTREDGFKGVNYAEMSAVLVEAVKELNAKVEKLEAENADLKAERSDLKAEVEKVEALAERLAQIEALLNSANPNKIKK